MANLNPLQIVNLLKSNNPRAAVEQIIQAKYPNNPFMQNLLQLGNQGNTQAIQQIVTQMFNQQGRDFNTEYQNFMQQIKHL